MLFGLALVFVAAVGMQPGVAPADDVPRTLTWRAPLGCPSEQQVRQRLESLVGDLHAGIHRDVSARAQAFETLGEEGRAPWAATIVIQSPSGESVRQLEASSCQALAEATAVLISVAMDPLGRSENVPEPATPPPIPGPADEPPVEPTGPSEPEPDGPASRDKAKKDELGGVVGIRAGVGLGPLPLVGATLGGRGGLLYRALRVELGVAYWFAQQYAARSEEPGGAFSLWLVDARICGVPGVRSVEFPLCAGTQLGGFWSRGTGVDEPRTSTSLWSAMTATGGFLVKPTGAFALGFEATLLVPLTRPRFTIEGFGEVHRPNAVGLEAIVVLEARIPR